MLKKRSEIKAFENKHLSVKTSNYKLDQIYKIFYCFDHFSWGLNCLLLCLYYF